MAITLETLVFELAADTSKYDGAIAAAEKRAEQSAKKIESLTISPTVNHAELTKLNQHLDKKVMHLKQVRSYFSTNAIIPTIDTKYLSFASDAIDTLAKSFLRSEKTIAYSVNRINRLRFSDKQLSVDTSGIKAASQELSKLESKAKQIKASIAGELKLNLPNLEHARGSNEVIDRRSESLQKQTVKAIKANKPTLLSSFKTGLLEFAGAQFAKELDIATSGLYSGAGKTLANLSVIPTKVLTRSGKFFATNLQKKIDGLNLGEFTGDLLADAIVESLESSKSIQSFGINLVAAIKSRGADLKDKGLVIKKELGSIEGLASLVGISIGESVSVLESEIVREIAKNISPNLEAFIHKRKNKALTPELREAVIGRAKEIYANNIDSAGTQNLDFYEKEFKKAEKLRGKKVKGVDAFELKAGKLVGVDAPKVTTRDTKELVITLGGYAGQAQAATGYRIAGNILDELVQKKRKDIAVLGARNPDTDIDPETFKNQKAFGLLQSLSKSALRGYNKDALEVSSQAVAALMTNPNITVKVIGESGGGFAAEDVVRLLNDLGFGDRVSGIGVGTPNFIGSIPSENYKKYIGKNREETLGYETHRVYAPMGLANVSAPEQNLTGLAGHPIEHYQSLPFYREFVFGKEAKQAKKSKYIPMYTPGDPWAEAIAGKETKAIPSKKFDLEDLSKTQEAVENFLKNTEVTTKELKAYFSALGESVEAISKEVEDPTVLEALSKFKNDFVVSEEELATILETRASVLENLGQIPEAMIQAASDKGQFLKVSYGKAQIVYQEAREGVRGASPLVQKIYGNLGEELKNSYSYFGGLDRSPAYYKAKLVQNLAVPQIDEAYNTGDSAKLRAIVMDLGAHIKDITDTIRGGEKDPDLDVLRQQLIDLRKSVSRDLMAVVKTKDVTPGDFIKNPIDAIATLGEKAASKAIDGFVEKIEEAKIALSGLTADLKRLPGQAGGALAHYSVGGIEQGKQAYNVLSKQEDEFFKLFPWLRLGKAVIKDVAFPIAGLAAASHVPGLGGAIGMANEVFVNAASPVLGFGAEMVGGGLGAAGGALGHVASAALPESVVSGAGAVAHAGGAAANAMSHVINPVMHWTHADKALVEAGGAISDLAAELLFLKGVSEGTTRVLSGVVDKTQEGLALAAGEELPNENQKVKAYLNASSKIEQVEARLQKLTKSASIMLSGAQDPDTNIQKRAAFASSAIAGLLHGSKELEDLNNDISGEEKRNLQGKLNQLKATIGNQVKALKKNLDSITSELSLKQKATAYINREDPGNVQRPENFLDLTHVKSVLEGAFEDPTASAKITLQAIEALKDGYYGLVRQMKATNDEGTKAAFAKTILEYSTEAKTYLEALSKEIDNVKKGLSKEDYNFLKKGIKDAKTATTKGSTQANKVDLDQEIPANIAAGLSRGMSDQVKLVQGSGRFLILAAEKAMKEEAEIKSPARKFIREVGLPIAQGIAKGVVTGYSVVKNAAEQIIETLSQSLDTDKPTKAINKTLWLASDSAMVSFLGLGLYKLSQFGKEAAIRMEAVDTSIRNVFKTSTAGEESISRLNSVIEKAGLSASVAKAQYKNFAATVADTPMEAIVTRTADFMGALKDRGLSDEEISGSMTAVSQISGKGTVYQEEIRQQLAEHFSGSTQIGASALGYRDVRAFNAAIAEGMSAQEYLPKFQEAVIVASAARQIDTYEKEAAKLQARMELLGATTGKAGIQLEKPLLKVGNTLLPFVITGAEKLTNLFAEMSLILGGAAILNIRSLASGLGSALSPATALVGKIRTALGITGEIKLTTLGVGKALAFAVVKAGLLVAAGIAVSEAWRAFQVGTKNPFQEEIEGLERIQALLLENKDIKEELSGNSKDAMDLGADSGWSDKIVRGINKLNKLSIDSGLSDRAMQSLMAPLFVLQGKNPFSQDVSKQRRFGFEDNTDRVRRKIYGSEYKGDGGLLTSGDMGIYKALQSAESGRGEAFKTLGMATGEITTLISELNELQQKQIAQRTEIEKAKTAGERDTLFEKEGGLKATESRIIEIQALLGKKGAAIGESVDSLKAQREKFVKQVQDLGGSLEAEGVKRQLTEYDKAIADAEKIQAKANTEINKFKDQITATSKELSRLASRLEVSLEGNQRALNSNKVENLKRDPLQNRLTQLDNQGFEKNKLESDLNAVRKAYSGVQKEMSMPWVAQTLKGLSLDLNSGSAQIDSALQAHEGEQGVKDAIDVLQRYKEYRSQFSESELAYWDAVANQAQQARDYQRSIEDFAVSKRDFVRQLEDLYRDLGNQSYDLEKQKSDFSLQNSRAIRDFVESYDDFRRDLNNQMVRTKTDIEKVKRETRAIANRTDLTKILAPGNDSIANELVSLYTDLEGAFNEAVGANEDNALTRLDIEEQTLEVARKIRGFEEQQEDMERDRLEQLRQLLIQQEDFQRNQERQFEDILTQYKGLEREAADLGTSLDAVGVQFAGQGNALVAAVNEIALKLVKASSGIPTGFVGGATEASSPGVSADNPFVGDASIVDIGKTLEGMGYHISRHSAWNNGKMITSGHSKNSNHYRDEALDINADRMPGGERVNLDRLYKILDENREILGIKELLWRFNAPKDHSDHLHVAFKEKMFPAIQAAVTQALTNTAVSNPQTKGTQVVVTKTGQKTAAGLDEIEARLVVDGQTKDVIKGAVSGDPSKQGASESDRKNVANTRNPLPDGVYNINQAQAKLVQDQHQRGTIKKDYLGITYDTSKPIPGFVGMSPQFSTNRTNIGFHPEDAVKGSAGCLVFTDTAAVAKLANWATNKGAKTMLVDLDGNQLGNSKTQSTTTSLVNQVSNKPGLNLLAEDLSKHSGFSQNKGAFATALIIAAGEASQKLLQGTDKKALYSHMGGLGNNMKGWLQYNQAFFSNKTQTPNNYNDLAYSQLSGNSLLPAAKGRFNPNELEEAVKSGAIATSEQLLKYLQSKIPIENWHGLHESGGGGNRIRQSGILDSMLKYLKSGSSSIPSSGNAILPTYEQSKVVVPTLQPITSSSSQFSVSDSVYLKSNFNTSEATAIAQEKVNLDLEKQQRERERNTAKLLDDMANLQKRMADFGLQLEDSSREKLQASLDFASNAQSIMQQVPQSLNLIGDDEKVQIAVEEATKPYLDAFRQIDDTLRTNERNVAKVAEMAEVLREKLAEQKKLLEEQNNLTEEGKDEIKATIADLETQLKTTETYSDTVAGINDDYKATRGLLEDDLEMVRKLTEEETRRNLELEKRQNLLDAQSKFSDIEARLLEAKANIADPFTAVGLKQDASIQRVKLQFAQERLEIEKNKKAYEEAGYSVDRMLHSLNKLEGMEIDRAFVEANPIAQAFGQTLFDIFSNAKGLGEALRDFAKSIFTMLAQWAANSLIQQIFGQGGFLGGLFGGGGNSFGGGGILATGVSSLFAPTMGADGFFGHLAEGGEITPYVSNFADGGSVGILKGLNDAMGREKAAGGNPMPVVVSVGEHILSTKNNDAQFYRKLKASGKWDSLKSGGVQNYAYGGMVGCYSDGGEAKTPPQSNSRYNQVAVVNNFNISTPDASSFRKSQYQIDAENQIRTKRALDRG